jgi:NADPH:quinone reductase-like Zn-dependent oxidoreductase
VPGTDGAGRVVSSAVFPPGTRVWIRGGGVGFDRDGCWAECVAAPDEAVHALTEDVEPAIAATFFIPCSTADVALHAVGALQPGERVGVRGAAGAVGSVAVQLARAAGAADVVAIVRAPEQAERVPAGARVVVAPGAAELADLAGTGLDLLVDTVGGPDLAAALPALRPGGRVAVVGYVAGLVASLPLPLLLGTDVRLLPVNGIRHEARSFERAPALLAELASGRLRVDVRAHPVERIDEALADLRQGGGGRVAVVF